MNSPNTIYGQTSGSRDEGDIAPWLSEEPTITHQATPPTSRADMVASTLPGRKKPSRPSTSPSTFTTPPASTLAPPLSNTPVKHSASSLSVPKSRPSVASREASFTSQLSTSSASSFIKRQRARAASEGRTGQDEPAPSTPVLITSQPSPDDQASPLPGAISRPTSGHASIPLQSQSSSSPLSGSTPRLSVVHDASFTTDPTTSARSRLSGRSGPSPTSPHHNSHGSVFQPSHPHHHSQPHATTDKESKTRLSAFTGLWKRKGRPSSQDSEAPPPAPNLPTATYHSSHSPRSIHSSSSGTFGRTRSVTHDPHTIGLGHPEHNHELTKQPSRQLSISNLALSSMSAGSNNNHHQEDGPSQPPIHKHARKSLGKGLLAKARKSSKKTLVTPSPTPTNPASETLYEQSSRESQQSRESGGGRGGGKVEGKVFDLDTDLNDMEGIIANPKQTASGSTFSMTFGNNAATAVSASRTSTGSMSVDGRTATDSASHGGVRRDTMNSWSSINSSMAPTTIASSWQQGVTSTDKPIQFRRENPFSGSADSSGSSATGGGSGAGAPSGRGSSNTTGGMQTPTTGGSVAGLGSIGTPPSPFTMLSKASMASSGGACSVGYRRPSGLRQFESQDGGSGGGSSSSGNGRGKRNDMEETKKSPQFNEDPFGTRRNPQTPLGNGSGLSERKGFAMQMDFGDLHKNLSIAHLAPSLRGSIGGDATLSPGSESQGFNLTPASELTQHQLHAAWTAPESWGVEGDQVDSLLDGDDSSSDVEVEVECLDDQNATSDEGGSGGTGQAGGGPLSTVSPGGSAAARFPSDPSKFNGYFPGGSASQSMKTTMGTSPGGAAVVIGTAPTARGSTTTIGSATTVNAAGTPSFERPAAERTKGRPDSRSKRPGTGGGKSSTVPLAVAIGHLSHVNVSPRSVLCDNVKVYELTL